MIRTKLKKLILTLLLIFCMPLLGLSQTDSLVLNIQNASSAFERIQATLIYARSLEKKDIKKAQSYAVIAVDDARDIQDEAILGEALFELAHTYYIQTAFDSSQKYLDLAFSYSNKTQSHDLSSRILLDQGKIQLYLGKNAAAIEKFTLGIEAAEVVDNYRLLGACYSSIGNIYRLLGSYDEALEAIIRAKSNYQLAGYDEGVAWIGYVLGRLYQDLKIYDEAELSFLESMENYQVFANADGDSIGLALCLEQIGLIKILLDKPEEAKVYIGRTLRIFSDRSNQAGLQKALTNMGKVEYALGNYPAAKSMLLESLTYMQKTKNLYRIPEIYEYLGLALIAEGKWQAGRDSLLFGLEQAKKNEQFQVQNRINLRLAEAYEENGNTLEALRYYKLQYELQKQNVNLPVRFKLPELRSIYELEQNRQKIKELNQKNEIISLELSFQETLQWYFGLAGIIIAIFFALVYKQYKALQASNTENERLIQELQTEMIQRKQSQEERLGLEKQLYQAQKLEAVGTMVGGIAHELNNILQSLFLYGDMIEEELPEEGSLKADMKEMLKHASRAKSIVQQILTFSRKSKIELKPRILHTLVLEAISLERATLAPNIMIEQSIDMNTGHVLCDKTQVHQIMINLCNNARDAMGDSGGILKVSLKEIQASIGPGKPISTVIELTIGDSGKGISEEVTEKIFDPFFTTKDIGKGTGLGLSVIHGIVELMGGHISVSSTPGEGTTFQILFPLADEIEARSATTLITGDKDSKPLTVLLVDDEESIREVTQSILSRSGFKVDGASNGQSALNLFQSNSGKYDLIITDLSMPEMSGMELARAIRKDNDSIPMILSTGQLGIENDTLFQELNFSSYLEKPWTVDQLLKKIAEI